MQITDRNKFTDENWRLRIVILSNIGEKIIKVSKYLECKFFLHSGVQITAQKSLCDQAVKGCWWMPWYR